jgi:hypothetical protein
VILGGAQEGWTGFTLEPPRGEVVFLAWLRINDILVWIRIRGSMPLTTGSGSGPSIFIINHQDAKKKLI